jgi:hypothetical protein
MTAKPGRFKRLVEKGGVECFQIRICVWFDSNGRQWTTHDVTVPEGNGSAHLAETLGALEVAKASILGGAA